MAAPGQRSRLDRWLRPLAQGMGLRIPLFLPKHGCFSQILTSPPPCAFPAFPGGQTWDRSMERDGTERWDKGNGLELRREGLDETLG